MADAVQTPNPLEACLRDGRDEEFAKCLAALELCNRSLSDYLETKRKRFPRFYFISSVDLIDVLSKGKHPPAVQEHFGKFTDSIAAIRWQEDEETGLPVGVACGMSSSDGEHVPFGRTIECRGAVEEWLGRTEEAMVGTLHKATKAAVAEYAATPRAATCQRPTGQLDAGCAWR